MNNEIKEILSYFEKYVKTTYMHDSEPMLNWKDLKIVLDYITNLQQENEILKTKTKEQSLLLIDYQDMEQKLENYKSRIEKAVEYVEEAKEQDFMWTPIFMNELLNILNGRSDE